jgi:hypothetical protein
MVEYEMTIPPQQTQAGPPLVDMLGPTGGRAAGAARFSLHFLEMVLAMMAGMMVFGAVVWGAVAASGLDYAEERTRFPAVFALVMALNMTAGMAVWMRYRGHGWRAIAEMSGAMVVPVLALFPLFWLGAIGSETLVGLEHALMLPAMLAVMLYRRGDYTHRHGRKEGRHVPALHE